MGKRNGMERNVKRSTILTITIIVALAFFLPMVMGGISAWNGYIADHANRNYHVRTVGDLITVDPVNETMDGDAVFISHDGTGSNHTYNPQTILFGNSSNIGYHTIVLEGVNDGPSNHNDSVILFRLNATTKNFRDNNTISLSMDVQDFNGTELNVTVWVQSAADEMIWFSAPSGTLDQLGSGYDTVDPSTNATKVWRTATVEFSYLDIITSEDAVGVDNYIVVAIEVEAGEHEFVEDTECNFRLYDSSLNTFGTFNTEAGYTFSLFLIGVFMCIVAVLCTPMVNVIGPGFTGAIKRDVHTHQKNKRSRIGGRR